MTQITDIVERQFTSFKHYKRQYGSIFAMASSTGYEWDEDLLTPYEKKAILAKKHAARLGVR